MSEETNTTTVSVDAGETGTIIIDINEDANVTEWIEAFERIMLFLGYQQESINKACARYGNRNN